MAMRFSATFAFALVVLTALGLGVYWHIDEALVDDQLLSEKTDIGNHGDGISGPVSQFEKTEAGVREARRQPGLEKLTDHELVERLIASTQANERRIATVLAEEIVARGELALDVAWSTFMTIASGARELEEKARVLEVLTTVCSFIHVELIGDRVIPLVAIGWSDLGTLSSERSATYESVVDSRDVTMLESRMLLPEERILLRPLVLCCSRLSIGVAKTLLPTIVAKHLDVFENWSPPSVPGEGLPRAYLSPWMSEVLSAFRSVDADTDLFTLCRRLQAKRTLYSERFMRQVDVLCPPAASGLAQLLETIQRSDWRSVANQVDAHFGRPGNVISDYTEVLLALVARFGHGEAGRVLDSAFGKHLRAYSVVEIRAMWNTMQGFALDQNEASPLADITFSQMYRLWKCSQWLRLSANEAQVSHGMTATGGHDSAELRRDRLLSTPELTRNVLDNSRRFIWDADSRPSDFRGVYYRTGAISGPLAILSESDCSLSELFPSLELHWKSVPKEMRAKSWFEPNHVLLRVLEYHSDGIVTSAVERKAAAQIIELYLGLSPEIVISKYPGSALSEAARALEYCEHAVKILELAGFPNLSDEARDSLNLLFLTYATHKGTVALRNGSQMQVEYPQRALDVVTRLKKGGYYR